MNPVIDQNRPARLTTAEVMALARVSRATLWRRIRDGRLPQPVDRARQALFCKAAVFEALAAASASTLSHKLRTEARIEALRRRRRSA